MRECRAPLHRPSTDTMTVTERRFAVLRRLALLCAAMVLAVTSLSAFIRQSKAGLGCADWPACYGQGLRQLQQGVAPTADEQTATALARLVHRVVAVIALLLVVTMLMVCFGSRPVLPREGALALALFALALFLAVLGRWSSAPRVPAVAIGNLLGGFLMLALCVQLARSGRPTRPTGLGPWAAIAALLLVMQIALGGLVSASYAGLACGGSNDCSLGAALQASGWDGLNPWREPVLDAASPTVRAGALAHTLHRHAAMLLTVLLVPLGLVAIRRGRRRTAGVLLALLAAQAAVGLAMSALSLPLPLALLHNLLAAGLLATLLLLMRSAAA